MRQQTPTAELISIKLDEPVQDWMSSRRGEGWSFGRMAAAIYAETGIYVTAQTLSSWSLERAS